jgi:hypothetical protein
MAGPPRSDQTGPTGPKALVEPPPVGAPRPASSSQPPPMGAPAPGGSPNPSATAIGLGTRRPGSTTNPPPVGPRPGSTTNPPPVGPRPGSTTNPPPVGAQTQPFPPPAPAPAAPRPTLGPSSTQIGGFPAVGTSGPVVSPLAAPVSAPIAAPISAPVAAPIAPSPTAPTAPAPSVYPPPPSASGTFPPPPSSMNAGAAFPPPSAAAPGFGGDPAFMSGASGFGPAPTNDSISIGAVKGASIGALVTTSARRAIALRIEPTEVLPAEKLALEMADPPVNDRELQGFLAWRRSILFAVIAITAPLALIRFIDALRGPEIPMMLRVVGVFPALAEAFLCAWCVLAVRKWTAWNPIQRKALLVGWLVFLLVPFALYLFPLRMSLGDGGRADSESMLFGMIMVSMQGLVILAPRALSLLPGLVRAGLATKLLFPGSAAPGWAVVVAAPVFALFSIALLLVPYQLTGSGWFVLTLIGVLVGQGLLVRAAWPLVRPCSEAGANHELRKVRTAYVVANGAAVLCLLLGLRTLAKTLGGIDVMFGFADSITVLLAFAANLFVMTLVGVDQAIVQLDRARSNAAFAGKDMEETAAKVAKYAGTAPATPPYPPPPPSVDLPPPPFG